LAIEVFGFAIKPEISIGDIAGVGALISSALVFWFGYSRSRKSEQIKIVRELAERIEASGTKLEDLQISSTAEEFNRTVDELFQELKYFCYLVEIREIRDENILRYYIPAILNKWFHTAQRHLEFILRSKPTYPALIRGAAM
jgi:hypothetical protein